MNGWICWVNEEDMPEDQRNSRLRSGNCVPVVKYDNPETPGESVFWWVGDALWSRLFGPILGPLWWEDATFHQDPMQV